MRFQSQQRNHRYVFSVRQIQEKWREQWTTLGMIFLRALIVWQSSMTSHMADHQTLWMPRIIRCTHPGSARRNDESCPKSSRLSDSFPMKGWLKQRYVIPLIRFSIYLAAMIQEIPDNNPEIEFRYRTDGTLFSIACLWPRTQTTNARITELQYVDDNCTLAYELEHLLNSVDNFSRAHMRYGLTINVAKTKCSNHDQDITHNRLDWRMLNNFPSLVVY